ncbi:hypothetical protein R1sor_005187 [Riccia sorocarpa]|uniref:Response regulatory domain-containing protein n=1 Tax=Riccia sorocarpa TaxID=122646 RepID=A0ABD3HL24_9MARC
MFRSKSEVRVLVVDDDKSSQRLVEKMLKKLSFSVTTTCSATEALVELGIDRNQSRNSKDFDLIISDFVMPGMTGFELLQRLKASPLRNVPVVIMSSDNIQDRIDRCLSEGAKSYLVKPVRFDQIKELRSYIRKLGD